jgi:hypothetical protein
MHRQIVASAFVSSSLASSSCQRIQRRWTQQCSVGRTDLACQPREWVVRIAISRVAFLVASLREVRKTEAKERKNGTPQLSPSAASVKSKDCAQARELERLGCPHAQGFLFSRPLSTESAEKLGMASQPLGPKAATAAAVAAKAAAPKALRLA